MITLPLTHRWIPDTVGPRKLLLVLHGRGDSLDGFTWLPDEMGLAGLSYLLVNAPDPYYGGWSWYDLPPDQGPGILRSRALIFATLDALIEAGWDSRDIILFGFSQGCLMAADVGARYPHPLGGVCGVSGYVYFAERLAQEVQPHARQTPWWISAGTRDDVVPLSLTQAGIAALESVGLPVEAQTYTKGHTLDPDHELPAIRQWLAECIGSRQG